MTIQGPIAINSPGVQLFTPTKGPSDFSGRVDSTEMRAKLDDNSQVSRQQWEKQVNTPQNTVVEFKGEIMATFGDNGHQTFFHNSDGQLVRPGSSKIEVLGALKNKYGSELSIHDFPTGKGPTYAGIPTIPDLDDMFTMLAN